MKNSAIIFDLSGTLVGMRPPQLLVGKAQLKQLAQRYFLGIITGAKRTETRNILKKLRVIQYFSTIITKDDSVLRKPNSQLFKLFLTFFNPEKIVYIGDTKKDYQLALNSGVDFYYVGKKKYGIYQDRDINKIINFIVKNLAK